tara:strand:- start:427 stop:645 length:219 start_codon:yes stop_codon:yes gene_type:complete
MEAIGDIQKLHNYLNEKQVSERLGVSVKLLRKHRWEGKGLPYVKFGARVLYAEPEVVEYLQKHRIETGKDLF